MIVAQILRNKGESVVTIGPKATIAEAARVLKDQGIGALVVLSDAGAIAGIISERDIAYGLSIHGQDLAKKLVAELMTSKVFTCSPDQPLDDIRRQMTSRRVRHIPVVDDGRLAGLVSIGDVVKNRIEELEAEGNQLREYISSG